MSRVVYFAKPVGMDGPIKIGCSECPPLRLETLAAWSPFPLEFLATIPGGFDLERNLHECFSDHHTHREWFRPSPALMAGIAALKRGEPVERAFDLTRRVGKLPHRKRGGGGWRPEMRLGMSWGHKLYHAQKRAARERGEPVWIPEDVDALVEDIKRGKAFPPTEEQTARLNAVVADPVRHSLTKAERWPVQEAA